MKVCTDINNCIINLIKTNKEQFEYKHTVKTNNDVIFSDSCLPQVLLDPFLNTLPHIQDDGIFLQK